MSSAIGSLGAYSTNQDLYSNARTSGLNAQKMGPPPKPSDPSEFFGKIDTDGDGKISEEELAVFQEEMEKNAPPDAAGGPKPPDAARMMSDMDLDGDSAISEEEFTSFMEKMREEMEAKGRQEGIYNAQGETGATRATLFDARA